MAFLNRLTEDELATKLSKQERLKADLLEQVENKLAQKQLRLQEKLVEDKKEYELEMASRGLEIRRNGGRGRAPPRD